MTRDNRKSEKRRARSSTPRGDQKPPAESAKQLSKEYRPEPESRSFRDGLSTSYIHNAWPSLPKRFREYQLLLSHVEPRLSTNITNHDKLQPLLDIIEQMLDDLAAEMDGSVEVNATTIVEISWVGSGGRDQSAIIQSMKAQPILVEQKEVLRMRPKTQLDISRQNHANCRFSAYLRYLEHIIEELTPVIEGLGIINPITNTPSVIGWTLKRAQESETSIRRPITRNADSNDTEARLSVRGCDLREVPRIEIERQARYRGIAHLEMRFERQAPDSDAWGTGWLVDSTTVVTAGHCVFDRNLGLLKSVDVVFGNRKYGPTRRYGTHAVVHWGWYTAFSHKSDLGIIRINLSVDDAPPLSYINTPLTSPSKGRLIIRGYPYVAGREDKMQWSQCKADYDLRLTNWSLEYELDSDSGMSGAPVFNEDGKVVGVHSATGTANGSHRKGQSINLGSIIDEEDNNIDAFCAVLNFMDRGRMGDLRGLFRKINSQVTRYTVTEF